VRFNGNAPLAGPHLPAERYTAKNDRCTSEGLRDAEAYEIAGGATDILRNTMRNTIANSMANY
jgi:hypothetical protein